MTAPKRFAAMLAAIVLIQGAARAAQTPTEADIEHRAQIDTARAVTARGEYSLAYAVLAPIASGSDYTKLSPGLRYEIDAGLAFDALQAGRRDEAHRAAMRAAESPLATPEDWVTRLELARGIADFEDAYATFRVLKRKAPDFAGTLTDFDISDLERGFGTLPNAAAAQFEFEQYLHDLPWRHSDPIFSPDVISYHYAQHLFAHLEVGRADAVASGISDPEVIAVMRADKRFDNVAGSSTAAKAVDLAAQRRIQTMQQALRATPQSIEIGTELAVNFAHVGRLDDGLAQIEKTIQDAANLPIVDRDPYTYDTQYMRALAIKAAFVFEEGRHDEALGMAAAITGCNCLRSWTSALLRGKWLVALGRGSEALTVLGPVVESELPLETRTELRTLLVCAASEAHSKAGEKSLAELRARAGVEPVALIRAFVCLNKPDDAASIAGASLANPGSRALILEEMQRFRPEKTVTDYQAEIARRWDAIRTRPDMQQAVAKVGRINAYNIVKQGDLY
jgi:hypothetical protein